MKWKSAVSVLAVLLPFDAFATEVDGVLSLDPVAVQSCLVVEIALGPGDALAGLRWYHNDATVPFPELLLMEGIAGIPPDLDDVSLILEQITGASLAWGDVGISPPITSTTDVVHAVFIFPENVPMSAEGTGGGPGIGYRLAGGGLPTYVSAEGEEWVLLDEAISVAVEPVLDTSKGLSSVVLSSLKAERGGGRRSLPTVSSDGSLELSVVPNPFNPRAEIRFRLGEPQDVAVSVYNLRGALVSTPLTQALPVGPHTVMWQGTDAFGHAVASGVYFVVVDAGSQQARKRVTLVR